MGWLTDTIPDKLPQHIIELEQHGIIIKCKSGIGYMNKQHDFIVEGSLLPLSTDFNLSNILSGYNQIVDREYDYIEKILQSHILCTFTGYSVFLDRDANQYGNWLTVTFEMFGDNDIDERVIIGFRKLNMRSFNAVLSLHYDV